MCWPDSGRRSLERFARRRRTWKKRSPEIDLRRYKALHFEKLRGGRSGQHSIRLNRQWRLILRMETDAEGRLLIIVEVANHY